MYRRPYASTLALYALTLMALGGPGVGCGTSSGSCGGPYTYQDDDEYWFGNRPGGEPSRRDSGFDDDAWADMDSGGEATDAAIEEVDCLRIGSMTTVDETGAVVALLLRQRPDCDGPIERALVRVPAGETFGEPEWLMDVSEVSVGLTSGHTWSAFFVHREDRFGVMAFDRYALAEPRWIRVEPDLPARSTRIRLAASGRFLVLSRSIDDREEVDIDIGIDTAHSIVDLSSGRTRLMGAPGSSLGLAWGPDDALWTVHPVERTGEARLQVDRFDIAEYTDGWWREDDGIEDVDDIDIRSLWTESDASFDIALPGSPATQQSRWPVVTADGESMLFVERRLWEGTTDDGESVSSWRSVLSILDLGTGLVRRETALSIDAVLSDDERFLYGFEHPDFDAHDGWLADQSVVRVDVHSGETTRIHWSADTFGTATQPTPVRFDLDGQIVLKRWFIDEQYAPRSAPVVANFDELRIDEVEGPALNFGSAAAYPEQDEIIVADDGLFIVDVAERTTRRVGLPGGRSARFLSANPATDRITIAVWDHPELILWDAESQTVLDTIELSWPEGAPSIDVEDALFDEGDDI